MNTKWATVPRAGLLILVVLMARPTHAAKPGATDPCQPRKQVVETARAAAGRQYRQDQSPMLSRDGTACVVTLWRIPKTPGGYRTVTIGAKGKVLSVDAGK